MMELPTPETDAVAEKNIYGVACNVDVDFARKLEQERDEAHALLDTASDRIEQLNGLCNLLRDERDEAREENKKFREALEWIAERYDDFKPLHSVAMDAYEMSCIAKSALRKEES